MQAAHVMDVIKANYSNSRYFRVLAGAAVGNSAGNCGNLTCTNYMELGGSTYGNLWSGASTAATHFDVLAIAPYFQPSGADIPAAWGVTLSNFFTEVNVGGVIPNSSGANKTTNSGNNYT